MQLVAGILRAFQAMFAAIVLGISVHLARGQNTRVEAVPTATGYAAFCGGFGVLVALIGITSISVTALERMITVALDALSALTMLASGIAYAVLIRNVSCSDVDDIMRSSLLTSDCGDVGDWRICLTTEDKLKSRCVSSKADSAFMFISFVTCLGVVGYSLFMRGRRSGNVSYP
ncbi:marvel domain-containing protein [Aspergillus aurantiobrunneus]